MKKITAILLSLTMSVTFVGCNGDTGGNALENQLSSTQPVNENKYVPGGEILGEITVSCYDTITYKDFLEEAAAAFEQKYPEAKVNIETFSQMPEIKTQTGNDGKTVGILVESDGGEQAKEDYINKINTELMSGKGADIIAIDVIPYYKYADKGQLENLNSYIESDDSFQINDYRENIFNAAQYKGGQYFFPIDYTFDYIAFDSSLFNESEQKPLLENSLFSYQQLVDIGKESYINANKDDKKEHVEMFGIYAQDMFEKMWRENYKQFIDIESKTVNLDNGDFTNLLKTVKEYEDQGYIKQDAKNKLGEISMKAFEKSLSEQYLYKANNSFNLLQYFNKDSRRKVYGPGQGNQENDIVAGQIEGVDDSIPYTYQQAYGINTNSTNKSTAWEFIKFLASEEMQTSLKLFGIPINNNALTEKAKQDITGQLYEAVNNAAAIELTPKQKEMYDKYMNALNEFSGKINTFYLQDPTINSIIDKEVENFFNGSKTPEEVAGILQNKIELYLSE